MVNSPRMNTELKAALISVATSAATAAVGLFLNHRWQVSREAKSKRAERANLDINVRRNYALAGARWWTVNPHWIVVDDWGQPRVRGYEKYLVVEKDIVNNGVTDEIADKPLSQETIDKHRRQREWMIFSEFGPTSLAFQDSQPCSASESHLFDVQSP